MLKNKVQCRNKVSECVESLKHLIKECDSSARKDKEEINTSNAAANAKFYGYCSLKYRGVMLSKSTNETIRIIDRRKEENACAEIKIGIRKILLTGK